jgi:hypothetical protein
VGVRAGLDAVQKREISCIWRSSKWHVAAAAELTMKEELCLGLYDLRVGLRLKTGRANQCR